ncbi:hypothetical protein [Marinomonas sp. IMCC 4694]|uniref:hypothetical protein n=1 Tax=Marinomonas sp. IMCC 4694 TaxID=2605432 RepID=UPI0011E66EF7|nr:hypothetical protein [Marinomonas sp. IMCC 4694]TYL48636.1 hypothetical protein FXV75_12200 [Marinomonas sp. IMCC 4694]
MKNNLILFPAYRQADEGKKEPLVPSDELIALRVAFDEARANWVLELAELPENNKVYSGSKK